MPLLGQDDETVKVANTSYSYSTTRIDKLAGSAGYTLVGIASDESPSVENYKKEMEAALKEAVSSCMSSPRADSLMLRHTRFAGGEPIENHGWKLLPEINIGDYDDCLKIRGSTALFDAALESIEVMGSFAADLVKAKYDVNGIQFFITDGDDNASDATPAMVKAALDKIRTEEKLESLITILIGVGSINPNGTPNTHMTNALKRFKDEAGITHYLEIKDTSKSSLAKLAAFISKSVSAASVSLNTGGPSKQLTSQSLTI